MLNRLSLNQKKSDMNHNSNNAYHQNEKENIQKHLNRGKRTSRLIQLDNCIVVKHIDQSMNFGLKKNYNSNVDLKLTNINMSLNLAQG